MTAQNRVTIFTDGAAQCPTIVGIQTNFSENSRNPGDCGGRLLFHGLKQFATFSPQFAPKPHHFRRFPDRSMARKCFLNAHSCRSFILVELGGLSFRLGADTGVAR